MDARTSAAMPAAAKTSPPLRWRGRIGASGSARGRDVRERFEIESEVAGGLKSLFAIFFRLEAMIDDASEGRGNICVRGGKLGRLIFRIEDMVSTLVSRRNARVPESIS